MHEIFASRLILDGLFRTYFLSSPFICGGLLQLLVASSLLANISPYNKAEDEANELIRGPLEGVLEENINMYYP
jgi:hypothetical protein